MNRMIDCDRFTLEEKECIGCYVMSFNGKRRIVFGAMLTLSLVTIATLFAIGL